MERCDPQAKQTVQLVAVCVALAAGFMIRRMLRDKSVWIANDGPRSSHTQKSARVAQRGTLTSIVGACTLTVFHVYVTGKWRTDAVLAQTFLSMIFGNVVGYVLDVAFASETGFALAQSNTSEALSYALSTLPSPNFARYMITVALDAFISTVLVDRGTSLLQSSNDPFVTKHVDCFRRYVPALINLIVGVSTFQAYTNGTRFEYAIRDSEFPATNEEFVARARKSKTLWSTESDPQAVEDILSLMATESFEFDRKLPTKKLRRTYGADKTVGDVVRARGAGALFAVDDATKETFRLLTLELESRKTFLNSTAIMLSTLLAGLVYGMIPLTSGKGPGKEHGWHGKQKKWFTVIAVLILISIFKKSGFADRAPKPRAQHDVHVGMGIFLAIAMACFEALHRSAQSSHRTRIRNVLIAGWAVTLLATQLHHQPALPLLTLTCMVAMIVSVSRTEHAHVDKVALGGGDEFGDPSESSSVPQAQAHASMPHAQAHASVPQTPAHTPMPHAQAHASVPKAPAHASVPQAPAHAVASASRVPTQQPAVLLPVV